MTLAASIPVMILAAGRGERMRPLTDQQPKPLLKVQGLALIDWHIQGIANAGFKKVVVNHAWLGSQIVEHIASVRLQYPNIEFHTSAEDTALETAGGIAQAIPLLDPQDYFLVINGDVFTPGLDFNVIQQTIPELRKNGVAAFLWMVPNPPHHPQGDFCLEGGKVMPKESSINTYTFSGIGIYHRSIFSHIQAHSVAKLAPLLRDLIEAGKVGGALLHTPWTDVGTPERLQELNNQS